MYVQYMYKFNQHQFVWSIIFATFEYLASFNL